MGGVTASILFFFCCGKFVPVFESLAGKKLFFPEDYTFMLRGSLDSIFFFNVSLKTASQKIQFMVRQKTLHSKRKLNFFLKQRAAVLSLCF